MKTLGLVRILQYVTHAGSSASQDRGSFTHFLHCYCTSQVTLPWKSRCSVLGGDSYYLESSPRCKDACALFVNPHRTSLSWWLSVLLERMRTGGDVLQHRPHRNLRRKHDRGRGRRSTYLLHSTHNQSHH